MYSAVIIVFVFIYCTCCTVDYWSDDFDSARNCEHKELMEQLAEDPSRCTSFSSGSEEVRWEECKKYLGENLAASCPNTKIEKVWRNLIVFICSLVTKDQKNARKLTFRPFRLEYCFTVR